MYYIFINFLFISYLTLLIYCDGKLSLQFYIECIQTELQSLRKNKN
jgi:hypothetical protein